MFRNSVLAAAAIGLALGASGEPARADLSTADRVDADRDISANVAPTGSMSSTGGSLAAVSGGSSASTSGSPGSTLSPVSGSLTGAAATVPEPPSPLPLLSALMGLAGLSMVRRYWRT